MPIKPTKLKREWVPERKAFGGRHKDNSAFYNSRKWRKFATNYRLKNPICVHCEAEGLVGPAEVVDHIQGLNYLLSQGINALDETECQGLCHAHHNKKSGKETHGYREVNNKKKE